MLHFIGHLPACKVPVEKFILLTGICREPGQSFPVSEPKNILGGPLQPCSFRPLTGFFRDGCCRTGPEDVGSHTVCAVVTEAFLSFSKQRGNDLSTPRPEYQFPGLKPGDRWCLCAARWREAWEAGFAPEVILEATHERALQVISRSVLEEHAASARP